MTRRAVDVLVIGSGPSGMAVALELAARGRQIEVLDDDLAWGGSARILANLPGGAGGAWASLVDAFAALVASRRVTVRVRTTAAGIYGDDILVASEAHSRQGEGEGAPGVEVLNARTLVLAPGAHDGVLAFEGNDLPGVMSARAACRLLALGVIPGARVVVAAPGGGGPFGDAYVRANAASGHDQAGHEARVVREPPTRVRGSGRVKGVAFAEQELPCDTLVIDAPRAPAYELCAQAGAALRHEARGFVVVCETGGRLRDGVFAAGEAVGTPLEPSAVRDEARALAARA